MAMVSHSGYPHDVRIRRECEALGDKGIEVDLVCLRQEGESPLERIGNVHVHRMPVFHRRGQGPLGYVREYTAFFIRAFWTLTRLHARHRYAVVQAHNLPDFIVFAALVPKLTGARVILDMHDVTPELFQSLYGISERSPTFGLLRFVEQMSLAFADRVITVNRNIRDLFLSRNAIGHAIDVVMNAPDPRYFAPLPRPEGSVSGNPAISRFRLFHHGQVLRRYSFETALDALAIVRRRIPAATLDIYGDGDEGYRGELVRYADRRGLNGSVRFHDRVPVEQVPTLIAGADVGLVPCRRDPFVDKVMLPVRLLEYAVMGLPAVVARVGTVESYFSDGDVAYYRPDDPEDMARQIVALHENPVERALMAERARTAVAAHEWPIQKNRYLRLIEALA
jgi:glycosyltransferase involved in cell wall biosynthesis